MSDKQVQMKTIEQWKDELTEFCRERPGASMAEIARLPDAGGERCLYADQECTLLIWSDLEQNLVTALCQMMDSGEIEARPCPVLVYLIDGCVLQMPIAKQMKRPYKKTHWLPVTLSIK